MDIQRTDKVIFSDSFVALVKNDEKYGDLRVWLPFLNLSLSAYNTVLVSFSSSGVTSLFTVNLRSLVIDAVSALLGFKPEVVFPSSNTNLGELFSTLKIDPHATFDNFCVGASDRLAFAATKALLEDNNTYNPLFLHSRSGLGKTHLLHALVNQYSARFPERNICFMSAESFESSFLGVVDSFSVSDFHLYFSAVDLLIIDDLNRLCDKPSLQNEFLRLFNHLYQNQKQLVFTSNNAPRKLGGFSEQLVSRLQWGLVVEIEAPDAPLRHAILHAKSYAYNISLPYEIYTFLSQNTFGNIRELEGILQRLKSHSTLLHQPVTMDLLHNIMKDYAPAPSHNITLPQIEKYISDTFKVSSEDLHSKTRTRSVAYPRQVAMFLAHSLTQASLEEIGNFFGGRDHSTIKHGCEKIKNKLKTDISLRNIIDEFQKNL